MALGLPASSTNIRRNQRNSYAKFAITPHQHSKVMIEQIRKRNYRQLGRSHEAIYTQLQVDVQKTSVHRRSQGMCVATWRNAKGVHPKMESYQKFSSRSIRRESNRHVYRRLKTRRPSRRNGKNQAEDSIRSNGCGK
jgi:hypothetical protein